MKFFRQILNFKLFLITIFSLTFCLGLLANVSAATQPVNVYLFYGDGCPHCEKEIGFLEKITDQDQIQVFMYEIYYDQSNSLLFNQVAQHLGVAVGGVPFTIIGDQPLVGYGGDRTTGKEIQARIDFCLENTCDDTVAGIINPQEKQRLVVSVKEEKKDIQPVKSASDEIISLPILGEINPSQLGLPLLTFIIAFMDGFNPCALWILIFLITMLINMEDKRKLYLLGSVFIVTSALVYFVFLAAWFNFFKFVGYVYWIKVVIGLVAIITGAIHLRNSLIKQGECQVTDHQQRASIMERIRNITQENNLWMAIIGMIVLAISVNFIEVVCSAGLPAVYTGLLSSANLSTFQYYSYLIFYTFIFMLDDLVIFFIAVKSFQATGITSKYAKYSGIIGGTIMLLIGFILIFKPELLMFG